MQTTIQLDDDVYQLSMQLSKQLKQPLDTIISSTLRQAFHNKNFLNQPLTDESVLADLTGISTFVSGKNLVTNAQVNQIKQQEEI